MSRDRVVVIGTGYGMDGWGAGVRIPICSRFFSFPRPDENWGPPRFYPIGSVKISLSPEVKWPDREVSHSPPPGAELKNTWIYIFTPPYVFMECCLISKTQENIYLLLYVFNRLNAMIAPWHRCFHNHFKFILIFWGHWYFNIGMYEENRSNFRLYAHCSSYVVLK
jgi:hypothetical protein